MGATITQQRVKMSENGEILLPTSIRHLTGFQPGDEFSGYMRSAPAGRLNHNCKDQTGQRIRKSI